MNDGLVQDQRPVEYRPRLLARNILGDQEEQLAGGFLGRERRFGFQDLAQLAMIALDGIGGVDQPTDGGGVVKHGCQVVPIGFPGTCRHGIVLVTCPTI